MATRRTKSAKRQPTLRIYLADNVRKLRDAQYAKLPNETKRNHALAKDADCSFSSIQRLLSGGTGPSIDTIELVAIALNVRPQELITPYMGIVTPVTAPKPSPSPRLHGLPKPHPPA